MPPGEQRNRNAGNEDCEPGIRQAVMQTGAAVQDGLLRGVAALVFLLGAIGGMQLHCLLSLGAAAGDCTPP